MVEVKSQQNLVTSNENIAESANNSAQLGWKISNFINGDSVNSNGSSQKSWNNNHANHPVLQHNANVAASVPEQNRDYNTVLVGGAGFEKDTKIYMKQWEEKFEKAGVVKPEYVPIGQGAHPGNITTTLLNMGGDIPYVLSDNITRHGPVNKIVEASNDDGGQRNIVGYSYGSVMTAHAALDMANQGIYVDNVGLVGSPISSDSKLYQELNSHKNIGNVERFDIPNDAFSNGIGFDINIDSEKGLLNIPNQLKNQIGTQINNHFYYVGNQNGQQDNLAREVSSKFNKK